jgi:hypothetical protein
VADSGAPVREADGFRDLRERNPRSRIPFCAGQIVERLEAEVPSGADVTLELPVSIYGGG